MDFTSTLSGMAAIPAYKSLSTVQPHSPLIYDSTMATLSRIVEHPFAKAVAQALKSRCGVREGDRLHLAVSGGADSVAMLRAIAPLAGRRTWKLGLSVGHVQHHLRDDHHAENDARLVEKWAGELGVPFCRTDLPKPSRKENVEAWARRERYRALMESAQACRSHMIVTAHHADDQLETILMRLLRGASIRGLQGMAWRRPAGSGVNEKGIVILRPMLAVDHAAAESFLKQIKQPWCEDHTNLDISRLRARLRHEVLPQLRAISPIAGRRAVRFGDHLRDVGRVVDAAAAQALNIVTETNATWIVPRNEARLWPRVVLAEVLRQLLQNAGVGADQMGTRPLGSLVRAVRDCQGGQRRFEFGNRVVSVITREAVEVRRK